MRKTRKTTSTTTGTAVLDMDELPTVEVGDVVLWSPDYGASPAPALVVAVGGVNNRSRIDVQIIHLEAMTLGLRSGVPHQDDPSNKIIADEDVGVWRKGPMSLRLEQLMEQLEDIKVSLAGSPSALSELAGK